MTPFLPQDLARLQDAFREMASRGLISPELSFLTRQLAHLAQADGDPRAMTLLCLMARWMREVEAGTDFEFAFRLVASEPRPQGLRLVKGKGERK